MGCFSTFIISLFLLSLAVYVLYLIIGSWAFLVIAAVVVAAGISAYLEVDSRLTRIEQHLGICPNKEKNTENTNKPES